MQKQLGAGYLGTQALYIWRPVLFEKSEKAQIPCIPLFSYLKRYDIIILAEEHRIHLKMLIMGPWTQTKLEQSSQFLVNSTCW